MSGPFEPEQTLYLVDGSAFIFRAYHAIRYLSSASGVPTNAVYGFGSMLFKLLAGHNGKPAKLAAVCFDSRPPTFRHEMYADYKANRPPPPEDLVPQFALCRELTAALGVSVLEQQGTEADDVIATMVRRARAEGLAVVIVSSDKDLMQLVTPDVVLYDTMKERVFGPKEVEKKFGVPPGCLGDLLALTGDQSDNIPGAPGIGPKTAAKLLTEYESLDRILAEAPRIKGAKGRALVEHADQVRLARRLVALASDLDLPFDWDDLTVGPASSTKLEALLRRISFDKWLADLPRIYALYGKTDDRPVQKQDEAIVETDRTPGDAAEGSSGVMAKTPDGQKADEESKTGSIAETTLDEAKGSKNSRSEETPVEQGTTDGSWTGTVKPEGQIPRPDHYEAVQTEAQWHQVLERLRAERCFAVDLETTSIDPVRAEIVGWALSLGPEASWYVPVGHTTLEARGRQLEARLVLDDLRPLLEDETVIKYAQNHKYEYVVLKRHDVELTGIGCDPMIASYLLDASHRSHGLDALSRRELDYEPITFKEVCGTGQSAITFDQVDIERATRYAAEDAELTYILARKLEPRIEANGMVSLMRDLEIPLARVLGIMELNGILLDRTDLDRLSSDMAKHIAELEADVRSMTSMDINLASPKQLQALLFDHLDLKPIKKTKTGFSTDAEVLEQLAALHPVAALIHEHRVVSKLKSTYVDALPKMINPKTGRLHTSYNQAVAATGRLSSSDPNLQNIPVRTDVGRRIRRAFVAKPGFLLVSGDYSQIELRVLAHLSGDSTLREAFEQNVDVHAKTAAEVFSVPLDQVTREQRRVAKAVNFGVVYGQTGFGLAKQIHVSRKEATRYIERYFDRHRGVDEYMKRLVAEATKNGYVTTILGRKRPLPALSRGGHREKSAAERMARNTPIQGSAADLIKLAMLACHRLVEERYQEAAMLLTIHDELVFEVPEAQAEDLGRDAAHIMETVHPLDVPLKVDVGMGRNWDEAH